MSATAEALLERAMSWLENNKAQFAIVNAQSHPYYSIKPVAELGEAAEVLLRTRHAEVGKRMLEQAWTQLRQGELIRMLVRDANTLVQAAIYMPFHRAGLRDPKLDELLAERAAVAKDVPVLHRLPVAATLTMVGLPTPWTLEQVIQSEWDTRMGSPFSLSATDLYMATHIAFYATDYGRKPGLAEAQVEYLQRWLPVWTDELAASGQLDLVAELVIASHCVGPECVDAKVWTTLASKQNPDGSIPYQVDDQRSINIPGMPPERERFLRDYHSTLVSMMAAALCNHA